MTNLGASLTSVTNSLLDFDRVSDSEGKTFIKRTMEPFIKKKTKKLRVIKLDESVVTEGQEWCTVVVVFLSTFWLDDCNGLNSFYATLDI